jgi:hypothetical protein
MEAHPAVVQPRNASILARDLAALVQIVLHKIQILRSGFDKTSLFWLA